MDEARVCVIDASAECALDPAIEAVIAVWLDLPVTSSSAPIHDESDKKIPGVTELTASDNSINHPATVVVFG